MTDASSFEKSPLNITPPKKKIFFLFLLKPFPSKGVAAKNEKISILVKLLKFQDTGDGTTKVLATFETSVCELLFPNPSVSIYKPLWAIQN